MTLRTAAKATEGFVIGREPTLIIEGVQGALQVIQLTVVPMPTWLHGVIAGVIFGLSVLLNRQLVTPVNPTPDPTPDPTPGPPPAPPVSPPPSLP